MVELLGDAKPFFQEKIRRVCGREGVDADSRFLELEYLSDVLTRHVNPARAYRDGGALDRVVDLLVREIEAVLSELDAYQAAADKILFYQGIFPEVFRRKRMNINFYAAVGRRFYGVVGAHRESPLFRRLADDYPTWRFILSGVREEIVV